MKNIEKMIDKNDNFNIEEFYLTAYGAAAEIITPIQTTNAYSNFDHCTVVQEIYKQIYDDFNYKIKQASKCFETQQFEVIANINEYLIHEKKYINIFAENKEYRVRRL